MPIRRSDKRSLLRPLGFSFLELLIATFILSFGLLSVAATENAALRQNHAAYLTSIASVQINNFKERFAAGVDANGFKDWNEENARLLPQGKGEYSGDSASGYQVTLCWQVAQDKEQCLATE